MTTKKIVNTYSIYAKIQVDVSVEISASSLENALEKARELETDDFIEVKGELNDSTALDVYSIYRSR